MALFAHTMKCNDSLTSYNRRSTASDQRYRYLSAIDSSRCLSFFAKVACGMSAELCVTDMFQRDQIRWTYGKGTCICQFLACHS